jgi:hypothetical protein
MNFVYGETGRIDGIERAGNVLSAPGGPAALVDLLNSIAQSHQALAYQLQPTVQRLLSDDHRQESSRRRQNRRSLVPEPVQLEEGDQNPRLMHGAIQTPISPEQSLLVQPELSRQPEKILERPTQDARKLEEAPDAERLRAAFVVAATDLAQPELGADLFLSQPGCTRLTASFGSRAYLTGHPWCRATNHPIAREPLSGRTQQRPRCSGWNRQLPPHQ